MAKRHYDDVYSAESARRTKEMEEAGMIHSDYSAVANMPQNSKMAMYSKPGSYLPESIDDTIIGVDENINANDSKMLSHFKPRKV